MNREQYLEALKPLALQLVMAVRQEGPAGVQDALNAIAALPPAVDTDPAAAALVLLAAAVNPDATLRELWGWTDNLTAVGATSTDHDGMSLAAVMCVAGLLPYDRLDRADQTEVVAFLRRPAWTPTDIAEHLDTDLEHIRTVVQRAANRAAAKRYRAARTVA